MRNSIQSLALLLLFVLARAEAVIACGAIGAESIGVLSLLGPLDNNGSDQNSCDTNGGDPVEMAYGEFKQRMTPLRLPGLLAPREIEFQYRSQRLHNGPWGWGWFFLSQPRIHSIGPNTNDVLRQEGAGSTQRFVANGGSYDPPPGYYGDLVKLPNDGFLLTAKDGSSQEYSPEGLLEIERDHAANETTYEYAEEPDGTKTKFPIVGPNGEEVARDYRLLSIIDARSREIDFDYYGPEGGLQEGRLKEMSDDAGRSVSFTYDEEGNLTSVESPETEYVDETGTDVTRRRITSFTYTSGFGTGKTALIHPRNHNLLTITDDRGETYLSNEYGLHDLVLEQDFGGGTYVFDYSGAPEEIDHVTLTDGNGAVRNFRFSEGHLTRMDIDSSGVHPSNPSTSTYELSMNCCGELEELTLPRGNGIQIDWDGNGNLEEYRFKEDVAQPDSSDDSVIALVYESRFNKPIEVTDPLGRTYGLIYDYEEGRDGVDYNGDGMVTPEVDGVGNVHQILYPEATLPDGTAQAGISRQFWYNERGQLIREVKPEGNSVAYEYYPVPHQSFGLLHKVIVDPGGLDLTTTYTYDSRDHLASIQNPRGETSIREVNALGELVRILRPLGSETKRAYDGNGNLVREQHRNLDENGVVRDPEWVTTTYTYDRWDRMLSMTEDLFDDGTLVTGTTQFVYDNAGNRTEVWTPEGHGTKFDYDERDLPWRRTSGYGSAEEIVEEVHFDENGNLEEWIDGNGKLWTTTFDLFDRAIRLTDPLGHKVEHDYNLNDEKIERRVLSSTNDLLQVIQFDPDELGRVTKAKHVNAEDPGEISESWFFFDRNNRLVKKRSPRGYFEERGYDDADRPDWILGPLGNYLDVDWDENGNLRWLRETDKVVGLPDEIYETEFSYDALDRRTHQISTDRIDPVHRPAMVFRYDSLSRLVETQNAIGIIDRYEYDLGGRLDAWLQDALGLAIRTEFDYDRDHRLTGMLDGDGFSTQFGYDSRNLLRSITYTSGPGEILIYDGRGQVETYTNRAGEITNFSYLDNGLLEERSSGDLRLEYEWTGLRRMDLARAYEGGLLQSTVDFVYDGFGRIEEEIQDGLGVHTDYDIGHNVSGLSYPSGLGMTIDSDELDRPSSMYAGLDLIASYSYAGRDRVQTRTTDLVLSHTWDGLRRPQRMRWGSVTDVEQDFDDVDRALYTKRHHEGGRGDVYGYDGALRLKEVWYDADAPRTGTAGYGSNFQVLLSGAENRTATIEDGATTPYNPVDSLHRYTMIGSVARSHDLKGNLEDDGTYLFEFDPWNRLTSVRVAATGVEVARYEHDALGRRSRRVSGGETTKYVYSGPRVMEEYVDNGGGFQPQTRYLYGAGLDEVLAVESGGLRSFAQQDRLGSVLALTDGTGVLVERYFYDAFGQPRVEDGSGVPVVGANGLPRSSVGNSVWFAGSRWDAEFGQYHMRSRQYDPRTGRFTSLDPRGYPDGPNRYSYVNSDPVNWIDPLGQSKMGPGIDPSKLFDDYVNAMRDFAKAATVDHANNYLATVTDYVLGGAADEAFGMIFGTLRRSGGTSIWTPGKPNHTVTNAYQHWKKHGSEFGGQFNNSLEYVKGTHDFHANPPFGAFRNMRSGDGAEVLYHPSSNTFAVYKPDGTPATMYKPDPAKHGCPSNWDYFESQQ